MEKIIFGQSKVLFVGQWFFVFFLSLIIYATISWMITDFSFKSLLIVVLVNSCFIFIFWKQVLSLNLLVVRDNRYFIKNFLRKKEISLHDVNNIKVSWFWHCGILKCKKNKNYRFPLDGEHLKRVIKFETYQVADIYMERLHEYKS